MKKASKKLLSFIMIFSMLFNFGYAKGLSEVDRGYAKKAIIIVPGICGSELFSLRDQRINGIDYEKGYRFWPPECLTPFLDGTGVIGTEDISEVQLESMASDIKLICCKSNGVSKIEMMPSNPILDCRNNPDKRNFGIVSCYKQLVNSIVKKTNKDEYDVIFFSYDWRQSNKLTALELEKLINEKGYKDVALIGHSMGCVVCASYLSKEENKEKVDKSIFLGAPFLGAPKAFSVLDEGRFIDGLLGQILAPVVNPIIKDITRNCKAVYELLPPKQHFDILKEGYLKQKDSAGNIKNIETYEDTVNFITYKIGGKFTREFLKDAQEFYDTLFKDGEFVLSDENLKVYNILGINQATPGEVVVKSKGDNKEVKVNGDGMVTIESALVGESLNNKKNYYLTGVSHMGLMSRPVSIKLVCDILNGKDDIKKMNRTIVKDKRPAPKEHKNTDIAA